MPYEIREENGKFCLYKKSGGDSLGCHESRDAAMAQMRAIYANEAIQENLALADSDLSAGRRIFELDTSDPGFFTNCMSDSEMVERYGDEERRARVCAFLHKKITGITPAEHESVILESAQSQRLTLADIHLGASTDKTGRAWEVVIIGPEAPADLVAIEGVQYVRSRNGRYWATRELEAAAPMFEGAKVYDNHLTDAEFAQRAGMRSPAKEWLGSLVGVHFDRATASLRAVFKVVDDAFARKLLNAKEGGVLDTIGLSIDVLRDFVRKRIGESVVELVYKITRVMSVDAVGDPAAGGRFVRALESIQNVQHAREANMEEVIKQCDQLIAAIDASMLPDEAKAKLKAQLEEIKAGLSEAPPAETPPAEAQQAMEAKLAAAKYALRTIEAVVKAAGVKPAQSQTGNTGTTIAEAQRMLEQANTALAAARQESQRILEAANIAKSQQALEAALAESGLPKPTREIVRDQFSGRAFEAADLKATIEKHRTALLAISDDIGRVTGHGHRIIQVGRVTEADRYFLDFMRLMLGNTRFASFDLGMKDKSGREVLTAHKELGYTRALESWIADGKPALPRASRLSNWYYELTGGGNMADGDYIGAGQFSRRALEANLNTGTLASIVKNAVNIILAANYSVRQQWWDSIVEQEDVDTIDQATLVRVFGVSTLPIVPEGDAYTELDMEDEEETATFFKRGGYLGVTIETFLRDKLNLLRAIPDRLSNAWYNTVGGRVAAVFTVNTAAGPVLADSGALFNATAVTSAGGHANLLTAALSPAAVTAVVTAMKKQTDQPLGAGERLGNENRPSNLLIPLDQSETAGRIVDSEKLPGGADNDTNPHYKKYEIVEVPNWTDANDWAMLSKPAGRSPINLIWLRGRRTPELFSAETDEVGAVFTNDELRFKVRKFMAEFSATYACAPVSDWRSLHKSNVA